MARPARPTRVRPPTPEERRLEQTDLLRLILEVAPQLEGKAAQTKDPERAAGLRAAREILRDQAWGLVEVLT